MYYVYRQGFLFRKTISGKYPVITVSKKHKNKIIWKMKKISSCACGFNLQLQYFRVVLAHAINKTCVFSPLSPCPPNKIILNKWDVINIYFPDQRSEGRSY